MPVAGARHRAVLTDGGDLRVVAAPGEVGRGSQHIPLIVGVIGAQGVPLIEADSRARLRELHRSRDHAHGPVHRQPGTGPADRQLCLSNGAAGQQSRLHVEARDRGIRDAPAQRSLGNRSVLGRQSLRLELSGAGERNLYLFREARAY